MKSLQIDESATLNNAGGLLYTGYHIRHDGLKFPNVSFAIRTFEGWNENNCHNGGYILMHKVKTGTMKTNYVQGPFCSNSLPSHPFVGNIGPKHIVLGSFQYFLIVYAFGPMYNIDIDIHVHPSDCEGLFEPQYLCYTAITNAAHKIGEQPQLQRYIKGSNYEAICMMIHHHGRLMYSLNTYNIKKCLVFQSISLRKGYNEYYTFAGTIDIGLTITKMPPYSSEGRISTVIDGYARFISLSLHTHKLDINRLNESWIASHLKISMMKLFLYNVRHSQGMYIYLHVDVVNITSDCTNSVNKKDIFWISIASNKSMAIFEISNLCGLLQYSEPSIYIFKYNFHAGNWYHKLTGMLFYMQLHTWCATNKTVNIFTVLAQRATISHSVSMTKKLFILSQQYEPIGIVYQNNIGCTFQLVYRARMYAISTYIGIDSGSRQSYIKVR